MIELLFQPGTPCRPEPVLDLSRRRAGPSPAKRRRKAAGLNCLIQVGTRESALAGESLGASTVSDIRVRPKPKEPVTDLHETPVDAEVKVPDI